MVLDKQEVRAVMSSTTVRLTRKELYEEIWKISVAGVSKNMVSHMPDVWQRSRRPKSLFLPLDIGPNSTSENLWNSRLSLGMGMPSLNCCRRHCPVPQMQRKQSKFSSKRKLPPSRPVHPLQWIHPTKVSRG